MKAKQLYALLDDAGIEYEVTEIFEGVRYIRAVVEEDIEEKERLEYIHGELVDWVFSIGGYDDLGRAVFTKDDASHLADCLMEAFDIYEKKDSK
jgi:hypothetical protein